MRKNRTIRKTVDHVELQELSCDFCNESWKSSEVDIEFTNITGFRIEPGYGSEFDDERLSFDICDNCLKKLKASSIISGEQENVE